MNECSDRNDLALVPTGPPSGTTSKPKHSVHDWLRSPAGNKLVYAVRGDETLYVVDPGTAAFTEHCVSTPMEAARLR